MVSKKKNDEKNKLKTINKGKARTQQTQGLATLTRKNKKGENGQMLEGGKEKNIYEILKNLANQKKTPGLTPLQLEQHTLGMSDEERQAIVNELKKEGVTITRPRHKAGQEKKQAESQSLQRRQNKEVKEALNQKKEKKPNKLRLFYQKRIYNKAFNCFSPDSYKNCLSAFRLGQEF